MGENLRKIIVVTGYIAIAAISLSVVVWCFWYISQNPIQTVASGKRMEMIPPEVIGLHDAWGNKALSWERIFSILTVASVILSTLVASGSSFLGDKLRNIIAVAAAISAGLIASFNPRKTAEDFWDAWRILNVAKIEFIADETKNLSYVASAVRNAESLLHKRRYEQSQLEDDRHNVSRTAEIGQQEPPAVQNKSP